MRVSRNKKSSTEAHHDDAFFKIKHKRPDEKS